MELVAHHVGSPAKVSNTEKKYLRDRWIDYLNAQCRSKGSSQKRWQTKGDRILSNFSITYIGLAEKGISVVESKFEVEE